MDVKYYLIIDDTESDATYLTSLLHEFAFLRSLGIVPTIELALQSLTTQSVDLVFLDIHLNDQVGLSLLKKELSLPPVIITSAHPNYALESYEIGKASDYLLKPFTLERLTIALTRAFNGQNQATIAERDVIFLKMGRRVQRFSFDSIHHIEAFGIYTKVYTDKQMFLVNERLNALLEQLPTRLFVRVHKSFVINVRKITGYDRQAIWQNQTKIPIGRSFRPHLEGLLAVFDAPDENAD